MKLKVADTLKHIWTSFEQYPQACWGFSGLWLLFISSIAFLWDLGSTGLVDETEPLFAEAARQMVVTGDWLTPYFNEATRFDKPPLIYWLMAIGYQLIGVNEWAVRLPSALAAIALTISCFFTLRYWGFAIPQTVKPPQPNRQTQRQLWLSAWIGSAIAAFNLETLIWSHQGVSDMLLSCCMGTALLCFFWGYTTSETQQKQNLPLLAKNPLTAFPNRWYLGFYLLTGLAVLTKGPVGLVLPGLIILSFLIYLGKLREVLREIGLIWGSLIFLAITLPWYILVILKNGRAFINAFFGYHNLERFTSVVNGHDAPWYFYFLVVLFGFLPWSIYLPLAMLRLQVWKRSFWQRQPRFTHLSLFAFFWFICIFLFFTVSITKLPSYILPLMSAATILVTVLWAEALTTATPISTQKGLWISHIFNVFFLIIFAISLILSPNFIGNDPAVVNLSEQVTKSGLPIRGCLIWATTATFIALFLRLKKQQQWIILAQILGFLLFTLFLIKPTLFFIDTARQLPLRQIATTLPKIQQPQEEVWMIGFHKPSIVFYSQKPIHFFPVRSFYPGNQDDIQHIIYLLQYPLQSPTILVISRLKDLSKAGLKPEHYQILEEREPYQLIRISRHIFLTRVLTQSSINFEFSAFVTLP